MAPDKTRPAAPLGPDLLAGTSRAITRVRDQVKHLAATRATVLLEGEPGTGKSFAARTIHQLSARHDKAFVSVRCGVLTEGLVEAELFGSAGQSAAGISDAQGQIMRADGGTLFLDEIETLPPPVQVKLLRVLQDRELERIGGSETRPVDVRVLASSSQDLAAEVRTGRFREDLYYRLSAAKIVLPPLRERIDDLPRLVALLLRELNREHGRKVTGVTRGVLERFTAYAWPDNLRELRNVLEHMVVFVERRRPLALSDLPTSLRGVGGAIERLETSVGMTVEEVERQLIAATLRHTHFDKPRAAAMLGIGLRTLYRKIQRYGLRGGTRPR